MEHISDAIRKNVRIIDYAAQIGLTPVSKPSWKGNAYTLLEHDSVRIDADNNVFYRNSTGANGGIIDFCMEFEHLSQSEAIKHLRDYMANDASRPKRPIESEITSRKEKPRERAEPELPDKTEGAYKRLYAYLIKVRGLDAEIIKQQVEAKQLYQDNRGNAVFCGMDYDGKVKYATLRTTASDVQFRGDVGGSNKDIGYTVNLIDNTPKRLFVAESPIDCLSLASMLKLCGEKSPPAEECAYLSLGGTSANALEYHIQKHPEIEKIYLCQDNDVAGNKSRERCREQLKKSGYKGAVINKIPKGKDFNNDLTSLRYSQINSQKQTIERELSHEIN